MDTRPAVNILYATVTGTAEDIAEDVAIELAGNNTNIISFSKIDEYPLQRLLSDAQQGQLFVFIVSTYGDGETPPCMRKFWNFVRRKDLPSGILKPLRFAIFGLGDRSYVKFNAAARVLCTRLVDLGASLIVPLALGDDSAQGGFDKDFFPWLTNLKSTLFPDLYHVVNKEKVDLKAPRVVINDVGDSIPWSKSHDLWQPEQCIQDPNDEAGILFESTVAVNEPMTNPEYLEDDKEVRHVELNIAKSLPSTGLGTYEPGDIIHIVPRNRPSAVTAFFELTNLDGQNLVKVKRHKPENRFADYKLNIRTPCTLHEFVSAQLDLSSTPRRTFFERLAPFATNELEKTKLLELSSPEGADDLLQYSYREKRTILIALRDFPSARPPIDHLIDMIPRLQSRPFSIASSVPAHPGSIHLCASIVRFKTPMRFVRVGVCSSFLLRLQEGDIIPIFLEKGTSLQFAKEKPAILVGPGTGVAPMRSFISSSRNRSGENILFFGCRNERGDYLYKDEWVECMKAGKLTNVFPAFSREDPNKKFYVQDRMMQESAKIWRLLSEKEAFVYVAGAAGGMPKAVQQALVDICEKEGKISTEEAERFVRGLITRKRLQMECW